MDTVAPRVERWKVIRPNSDLIKTSVCIVNRTLKMYVFWIFRTIEMKLLEDNNLCTYTLYHIHRGL